jgi:hypothetical protein
MTPTVGVANRFPYAPALMGAKDETAETGTSEWFICVRLPPDLAQRPHFYVLPRMVVSALLYLDHRHFLATPGKGGRPHVDSPVRNCGSPTFMPGRSPGQHSGLSRMRASQSGRSQPMRPTGCLQRIRLHVFLRGEPPETTPASSRGEPILAQIAQIRPDIAERFMHYVLASRREL